MEGDLKTVNVTIYNFSNQRIKTIKSNKIHLLKILDIMFKILK